MSVVAATMFFTMIPVGYFCGTLPVGWATDRIERQKKLLIAAGLGLSGGVYVLFGQVREGGWRCLSAVQC
eukprot:SAG22_NODE_3653_length_1593_cov_1.744311_2_plen_69_part_01